MKRLTIWVTGILLLTSLLCVGGLSFGSEPAAPETIVFGTNTAGSLIYVMGAGLANVIQKNTEMTVEVLPQTPTTYYPMLETGEVDFGAIGGADVHFAYMGKEIYDKMSNGKGYDISVVVVGGPLRTALFAAKDANINTLKDLKGKRVITKYGSFFGSEITTRFLLANAGLTVEDVIPVSVSNVSESARAIKEGRADVGIQAIGSASVEELNISRPVKPLPADTSPEALERSRKIFPGVIVTHVKPGPVGVEEPIDLLVIPIYIFARNSLADKAVYDSVKAIWQNLGELSSYHAAFKLWKTDNFASPDAAVPYHQGAIDWYKEQGVWTTEMENRQKETQKWKK